MKRKLIMLVLVIALIVPVGQAFSAESAQSIQVSFAPLHYVIDGVDYAAPEAQLGFISAEGRTYVPIRYVANILQKTILWNGDTSKVTIADPTTDEERAVISAYLDAHEVKNSVIDIVDPKTVTFTGIPVYTRKVTYEFNGQLVEENPLSPGLFYNNSIYVPLRFVYESLGYDPKFDQSTYTIEANSEVYTAIVEPSDALIEAKKSACISTVLALRTSYLAEVASYEAKEETIPAEVTAAFIVDADTTLLDCRTELDVMLDSLTTQLEAEGMSTNIVANYEIEIGQLEFLAKSFIQPYRAK